MLLYFKTKNYRSIKDEAVLNMEAASLKDSAADLLQFGKNKYLPAVAIYGKNGGGKSNLIRAMWLAVQFICNAQKTQTENAKVPVIPVYFQNFTPSYCIMLPNFFCSIFLCSLNKSSKALRICLATSLLSPATEASTSTLFIF